MLITGNTYPVKEQLKAMGGRWNNAAQGWDVPEDKAEAARAVVAAAGPAEPRAFGNQRRGGARRYGSTYTRFNSGAEQYHNKHGRCIDAPCCGCCS